MLDVCSRSVEPAFLVESDTLQVDVDVDEVATVDGVGVAALDVADEQVDRCRSE